MVEFIVCLFSKMFSLSTNLSSANVLIRLTDDPNKKYS